MADIPFNEVRAYSNSPISRAWRYFWHVLGAATGDGSLKLAPTHHALVDALLVQLEPNLAKTVRRQLDEPFYIQYMGRISVIFFNDFNLPLELRIQDADFLDRLFRIEMFVDDRKRWANVTFFNGRIHSLELRKPLKYYRDKSVRFGAAKLGKPTQSMTYAIDRQEHGREEI
ncbi:MAG: hypothetical protein ACX930_12340 [Erythrobacter sp.]